MEETIYVVEENEEEEEVVRVRTPIRTPLTQLLNHSSLQTIHKKSEMLFVRGMSILRYSPMMCAVLELNSLCSGDSVVLISPQAPS